MSNAERRRQWTGAVARGGPDEADADARHWVSIPIDERARLTWDLSAELYSLARLNRGVFDEETGAFVAVDEGPLERRLPRAAFRISRR